MTTTTIRITCFSLDGCRVTRTFKTLKGAQAFAAKWVGETPELGRGYAVSGDGIGKVIVTGRPTLIELFPKLAPATDGQPWGAGTFEDFEWRRERERLAAEAAEYDAEMRAEQASMAIWAGPEDPSDDLPL